MPNTYIHPTSDAVLRTAMKAAFTALAQSDFPNALGKLRLVEEAMLAGIREVPPDHLNTEAVYDAAVEALILIREALDGAYQELDARSTSELPPGVEADRRRRPIQRSAYLPA